MKAKKCRTHEQDDKRQNYNVICAENFIKRQRRTFGKGPLKLICNAECQRIPCFECGDPDFAFKVFEVLSIIYFH